MRRRELILALGGSALWPIASRAQQTGKTYRIAVLTRPEMGADLTKTTRNRHWRAWQEELRRLGYVEGKNLAIDRRTIEGSRERIDAIVREIVSLRPDVIFSPAQNIVDALKVVTTTIPIVAIIADPVGSGYAASLARPGGNITGFSLDAGLAVVAKRIALLKEVVPTASRMACLTAQAIWESRFGDMFRRAARQNGITMIGAPVKSPANEQEYRRVFAAMARDHADSLYLTPTPEHLVHRQLVADLATQARLPTICFFRENVEAGGLMSYSIDIVDTFRRAAGYIDRVLKGADPADMPFQQPSKFELVVNIETARALGLAIPPSILARADEVIE